MLRRRTLFCLLVHTNNMEKVIFSNMPPQLIWLQFLKVLLSIPVPLVCPLILIRFRRLLQTNRQPWMPFLCNQRV